MIRILIAILTVSVKKHGENTPVTLGHLLNIFKMVEKFKEQEAQQEQIQHNTILNEIMYHGQS